MATKKAEHSSGLIKALKFMELCGSEHCFIGSNQVTAYTNSVAVGHPIEEDLNAIAHIKFLKNALLKSPLQTKITQLELSKLQVDTGEFTVYVNAGAEYAHTSPDEFVGQLPASLGASLASCLPLLVGNDSFGSAYLRNGSLFATNRRVLVEFWHGLHLPELLIPKELIKVFSKTKKQLAGFGFSENSVTLYFSDGSWAMARSKKPDWFEPYDFFNKTPNPVELSIEFAKAVSIIKPFCNEGKLYFIGNAICSHSSYDGAKFNIASSTPKAVFMLKDIEFLLSKFKQFDCVSDATKWEFFGDNVRAVVALIEE